MMDIDHFKKVNDNYGHSAGDKVLQTVAKRIKNKLREIDIVARIGGEEFAFVLPETSLDEAVKLVERLRLEIADTAVVHNAVPVKITASFGICSSMVKNETHGNHVEKGRQCIIYGEK